MADQLAQDRNMVLDSRAEFEADAEPMGFDLTRISLPVPEPWSEYADENTGHRWGGWLAATQRQQERIAYVEKIADDAIELGNQQAIRIAELEAQVQALSLDAFAKDASIGHLSRLVDAERTDATRYQWLRGRDLETISHGGVFAGKTPDNVILNGEDLDRAIDAAIAAGKGEA